MVSEEILKAVFCFLEGTDLASCMSVCKNWRGVAQDDYFWKCLCAKKWPSFFKRPTSPSTTYYMIYSAFNRRRQPKTKIGEECYPWKCEDFPPPRLSFDDTVLYLDTWVENELILSKVIPGTVLKAGIDMTQGDMRFQLVGPQCKISLPMESKFGAPLNASILVGRNDYNKIACIINRARFTQIDNDHGALGYDYLNFSPSQPFVSPTQAWIYFAFGDEESKGVIDVYEIEMDFDYAVDSEQEFLGLLDMLDWK